MPPLDWWVIDPSGYDGAHFATFPPELITRPVIASCPEGGTILDPFGGSGTTAAVATGHGRNCISFDINESNLDLARERVGMFLTEAERTPA
ncbi:site-specific DNA-methyltransferase [Nannocystis sp.]|uniref:site-specific DNA-methyltransferase n=1 Tax=Nannocystis sp. TaxID=1962667 RepID=UPI00344F4EF4